MDSGHPEVRVLPKDPGLPLTVYCDGAARGNPGPAGIGVVLYRSGEDEPLATIGESIGVATNNVAEYRALLRGLSEALLRGADEIEVRTDSELMARQISGRYKVTSPLLGLLFLSALFPFLVLLWGTKPGQVAWHSLGVWFRLLFG